MGVDDVRGLYAARTLARSGVEVLGIANDLSSYGARTRACARVMGADTTGEELIELLANVGRGLDQKAVLVPCYDVAVANISRNRRYLDEWFRYALPSAEAVEILTDKIRFASYARSRGLPIPETRFLRDRGDAERAAREMRFPLALKPRTSKAPRWLRRTHLKAFKADSGAELLELYDSYAAHAGGLLGQAWIDGDDMSLYTCNCYLDANGEALVTFMSRKLRQWPPQTGEGCLSVEWRDDELVDETLNVFNGFDFHGLGYVEFKRDPVSGRALIIEPNIGRPTGRCGLIEASGVSLLHTMYCDLAELPLPENRTQRYRGTKLVWLRRDLFSSAHAWRRGELSLRGWLASLRGPKADAVWSWRDPVPFLADLARVLQLAARRGERSKRQIGTAA